MADLLKEAKIKRRNAKAALTRAGKSLRYLIESKRTGQEVRDFLSKVQETYEALVVKHEEFTQLIEDDNEFDEQEAWLAESQDAFMSLEIHAKLYLESTEGLEKEFQVEESRSSDIENRLKNLSSSELSESSIQRSNEITSNNLVPEESSSSNDAQVVNVVDNSRDVCLSNGVAKRETCGFKMEKPKMPKFSGDVRDYAIFRADFKHAIETRYSKRDCLTYLRTCLQGRPLELIKGIGSDYDAAWEYLDSIYADPRFVSDTITQDIVKFRPIRDGEDARFCELVHLVRRCYNTLREVGLPSDMNNSHMLSIIEQKMCADDRKVWSRDLEKTKQPATLLSLMTWMITEMKARMRATAPIRTSNTSHSIHHVATGNKDETKGIRNKCWICKTQTHWTDECRKFLALDPENRVKIAQENHACYSCLKRAGRDHKLSTCSRRKQCTEKEDGIQCSEYHHPLLHKKPEINVRANIAAMTEKSGALLPVISASIEGRDGLYKHGNILLDSGAQISLIRLETAENLRLEGKSVSITITKIGGEEEEMTTKAYNVRVTSLENRKTFSVKAIGIPCISDDIVDVKTKDIAEALSLRKDNVYRGKGPVDLLIGIDHARMHTGETRQAGHLVARHSPLGWVIFGATPGYARETNSILYVKYTMTEDLSDFCNEARRFKPFVSIRVGEIQSNTDPAQWRHIPGELNVADDVSRGIPATSLVERWKHGPKFLCLPEEEWPHDSSNADQSEVEGESRKVHTVSIQTKEESPIDCTKFSSWRRLIRVTAYILRVVWNLRASCHKNKAPEENNMKPKEGPLSPEELESAENHWIKESQKSLKDRLMKGELKNLSPYTDSDGIVRVGGRADNALVSYETKHPALLPRKHWISLLITRHVHQCGHTAIATTVAKTRKKFWILKAHDLAKSVKFKCVFCREMQAKVESQVMADLPECRLAPLTPPFYYTSCDYFGPYNVKIGRNKTTKYYGVIFTCLNTRAVHLELAVDYSTMEFIQVLRRFFAVRGRPSLMISDNGSQLVGAERELREMVKGWDTHKLREFSAEKGMQWKFTTPASPHQNGCAEALVKSCKLALKKAIGEQVLTPFELYTCLLEVANLVNQRPIGRIPNDPDDGSYLCPNDILLGRASSQVPQGPFRETKNPRHRVEFVQHIVDSFWKRWTRDVFPSLLPRKKWHAENRNVRVDDFVIVESPNAIRGNWNVGRIVEVYPGQDGNVRNVRVKTHTGEYQRPITKIAVIQPAEGYD